MAVFPKYHELICDTYTPEFVPGPEKCVLPSSNVTRSRLVAGGTFFRSVDVLTDYAANSVKVGCTLALIDTIGGGGSPEPNTVEIYEATLTVYDANNDTTIYTAEQRYDSTDGVYIVSAIPTFRTALAADPIVDMPTIDVQQPWDASTDDADSISAFPATNLSGGNGVPSDTATIDAIRTGPAYTLYHIQQSEETQADGSLVDINKIVEYNGTAWVNHPSTLYSPDDPVTCP